MLRYAVGLPNVGEFGDPRVLVELGMLAEAHGWDAVYVWDHVLYHDPQGTVANPVVAVSALAAATTRIRLVMMTALPRRRTHIVARETASLDVLSGGRLVLGAALGSMDEEYAAFGEDPSLRTRAANLDASLDLLDRLWSGAPVTLPSGDTVTMLPAPVQRPRIPIWVAGRWPNRPGFRRAAKWDGMFATFVEYGREKPVPPSVLAEAVAFVARERGTLDGYDVVVEGWTEPSGTVAPYAEVGLTWWIEAMGWWRGGVDGARARIAAGPPHA